MAALCLPSDHVFRDCRLSAIVQARIVRGLSATRNLQGRATSCGQCERVSLPFETRDLQVLFPLRPPRFTLRLLQESPRLLSMVGHIAPPVWNPTMVAAH